MHRIGKISIAASAVFVAVLALGSTALAAPISSSILGERTFTCPRMAADGTIPVDAATVDNYSTADLRAMAVRQTQFDAWLAGTTLSVGIQAIAKAPLSATVATTLHLQQLDHYCGPATVEIIDDKWGPIVSGSTEYAKQQVYANYMGVTDAGTDFRVVDNALNYYITESGVTYVYRDTMGTQTAVYDTVQYDVGVASPKYPVAADLKIAAAGNSNWLPYKLDHDGHIVCIDGYDFNTTVNHIRLQDCNNEATWHPGTGGATSGHHSYPKGTVANGVLNSMRDDMIW